MGPQLTAARCRSARFDKPPEPRDPWSLSHHARYQSCPRNGQLLIVPLPGHPGEPPVELVEPAAQPGDVPDGSGDSLSETDWETTRYLAVSTQLNLRYARFVVSQIIGEPFRAVAPAAGADVVVVTRWALAALRRRAWRDAALTGLLATGLVASIWGWTWIPVAVVAALAISVVAYEQWVRDVKVLARLMLRGRFRARHAPSSSSQRVEDRLAVVQQQQNGNLVVSAAGRLLSAAARKCYTTASW